MEFLLFFIIYSIYCHLWYCYDFLFLIILFFCYSYLFLLTLRNCFCFYFRQFFLTDQTNKKTNKFLGFFVDNFSFCLLLVRCSTTQNNTARSNTAVHSLNAVLYMIVISCFKVKKLPKIMPFTFW